MIELKRPYREEHVFEDYESVFIKLKDNSTYLLISIFDSSDNQIIGIYESAKGNKEFFTLWIENDEETWEQLITTWLDEYEEKNKVDIIHYITTIKRINMNITIDNY